MKYLLIAIALMCNISNAEVTGNDLKQSCDYYGKVDWNDGYCMGMIKGTLDTLSIFYGEKFCVPSLKLKDSIWIIKGYMKDNPKALNQNFIVVIAAAMIEAFPCGEATNKTTP